MKEYGLARARAAIWQASRSHSYVSNKEEGFVPRGSIYLNPRAFHQLSISSSTFLLLLLMWTQSSLVLNCKKFFLSLSHLIDGVSSDNQNCM